MKQPKNKRIFVTLSAVCVLSWNLHSAQAIEHSGSTKKSESGNSATAQIIGSTQGGSHRTENGAVSSQGVGATTGGQGNNVAPAVQEIDHELEEIKKHPSAGFECQVKSGRDTIIDKRNLPEGVKDKIEISSSDSDRKFVCVDAAELRAAGGNSAPTVEQLDASARNELHSLEITKPTLHIDRGPHTYTDLNTNFYVTNASVQTKKVTLLGQDATIELLPVNFTYTYGNGDPSLLTSTAGSSGASWNTEKHDFYKTATSHRFQKAGNFHSYVTVIYQARYRIGDGPWRVIDTVDLRSDAMLLRVWEIDVHNVAKDCREDPYAWACPMNKNHPDYNNPNPKLAHPDPFTGQQWHKDNAGVGDTERGKKPRSRERG